MRRLLAGLAMAGGLAVAIGCEPEPSPGDEEAPQEETRYAEIKPRPHLVDDEPEEPTGPPTVEFAIWPGGGDWAASELMWLGSGEALELRESPHREASVIAEGRWEDGDLLEWSTSLVRVDAPRPYRVESKTELLGTPYDTEFGELEAKDEVYELDAGARVWLYQYDGDGMCYLLVDEEVILSDCPGESMSVEESSELEEDQGFKPLGEQWWIEVNTDEGQGWFMVHDAPVEVHSRKAGGFDDIEAEREFELGPGDLLDY
jgi:hypothetical protein